MPYQKKDQKATSELTHLKKSPSHQKKYCTCLAELFELPVLVAEHLRTVLRTLDHVAVYKIVVTVYMFHQHHHKHPQQRNVTAPDVHDLCSCVFVCLFLCSGSHSLIVEVHVRIVSEGVSVLQLSVIWL